MIPVIYRYMIPVIYRYTIPVIYRDFQVHDSSDLQVHVFVRCRCVSPLRTQEYQEKDLIFIRLLFNVSREFFLLMETSMLFYTVSFFLRSSTIVCDIYTCCRALRTVATFTCFKTRVFHDRNCHNRPSDLRDERSNKMRRRRDKRKGQLMYEKKMQYSSEYRLFIIFLFLKISPRDLVTICHVKLLVFEHQGNQGNQDIINSSTGFRNLSLSLSDSLSLSLSHPHHKNNHCVLSQMTNYLSRMNDQIYL